MHIQTIETLSGKLKIKIPTNLNEVSLSQMIAMQSLEDGSNEIPLIPGLTEDVVNNIINFQDLIDIRERILSLAHQIKYCYDDKKIPEYITIGTKQVKHFWGMKNVPNRVKVIKNLSIEPAGALFASRDLIADERIRHIKEFGDDWEQHFIPSLDCCAGILAHYLYCPATDKLWEESKANLFKEEILKLSIAETLPIARFFFLKYPVLSRSKVSILDLYRMKLKKRLESRTLKNSHIGTL